MEGVEDLVVSGAQGHRHDTEIQLVVVFLVGVSGDVRLSMSDSVHGFI